MPGDDRASGTPSPRGAKSSGCRRTRSRPRFQHGRHLLRISDAARRTRNDPEAREAAGQAVAELREAVRLLPPDPDTHDELGRGLKQHGDLAAAISLLG